MRDCVSEVEAPPALSRTGWIGSWVEERNRQYVVKSADGNVCPSYIMTKQPHTDPPNITAAGMHGLFDGHSVGWCVCVCVASNKINNDNIEREKEKRERQRQDTKKKEVMRPDRRVE